MFLRNSYYLYETLALSISFKILFISTTASSLFSSSLLTSATLLVGAPNTLFIRYCKACSLFFSLLDVVAMMCNCSTYMSNLSVIFLFMLSQMSFLCRSSSALNSSSLCQSYYAVLLTFSNLAISLTLRPSSKYLISS